MTTQGRIPRKRAVVAVALVSAMIAGVLSGAPGPAAAATPFALRNSAPVWLGAAQRLGAVAPATQVQARVYLQPSGGTAALQAYADAVSTPGSASYGQFLSPEQYQARFGVPAASVQAVSSWLRSRGLAVTSVAPGNEYLTVQGKVAVANRAFATSIQRFRHDGQTVQAPVGELSVPASLEHAVLSVTGLDTTTDTVRPTSFVPDTQLPFGYRNAGPCSSYYGQRSAAVAADGTTALPAFRGTQLSYVTCGYVGTQLRAAYEGIDSAEGRGVTIGIIDAYASPTIAADARTYATRHHDLGYGRYQLLQSGAAHYTDAANCDQLSWFGEETLDIEAAHAIAPQANIRYYAAGSCNDADFVDALDRVVQNRAAWIISGSWGDPETNETAGSTAVYHQLFLRGISEGMSFVFSSGDDGDERAATGVVQATYPASDPSVTSVGGTSTGIGAANSLLFQTGWGTYKYSLAAGSYWADSGFLYGAGGGTSRLFTKPGYQSSLPGTRRLVPDVAMDADPQTGFLIGETLRFPAGNQYGEYRVGGTSLAAPMFAAMTALSMQHAGKHFGALNPLIYTHTQDFTDVASPAPDLGVVRVDYANNLNPTGGLVYTVRTFDQDSSLALKVGWDTVTGLGTPNRGWIRVRG